jgi:hypothetical protein
MDAECLDARREALNGVRFIVSRGIPEIAATRPRKCRWDIAHLTTERTSLHCGNARGAPQGEV